MAVCPPRINYLLLDFWISSRFYWSIVSRQRLSLYHIQTSLFPLKHLNWSLTYRESQYSWSTSCNNLHRIWIWIKACIRKIWNKDSTDYYVHPSICMHLCTYVCPLNIRMSLSLLSDFRSEEHLFLVEIEISFFFLVLLTRGYNIM